MLPSYSSFLPMVTALSAYDLGYAIKKSLTKFPREYWKEAVYYNGHRTKLGVRKICVQISLQILVMWFWASHFNLLVPQFPSLQTANWKDWTKVVPKRPSLSSKSATYDIIEILRVLELKAHNYLMCPKLRSLKYWQFRVLWFITCDSRDESYSAK